MSPGTRMVLAIGIVFFDWVMFMVPLGSCFLAYVLIARPAWFLAWLTKEVYHA